MNLDNLSLPKIPLRPHTLKQVILGCGLAGLVLRLLLMAIGVDDKGLLTNGHFCWVALCILSGAVGIVLFLGTRPMRSRSPAAFPRSLPACIGCAAAAVSSVFTALADFRDGYAVYAMAGLAAALALAVITFCRGTGRKPMFWLYGVICVHFALQMLKLYQVSSFDPQIQNYFFQLLACIALTLTAYQLAAFSLGQGGPRSLWLTGLAAVYLCCVSLGGDSSAFFFTGGLWALTSLRAPRRPRPRNPSEPEPIVTDQHIA